MVFLLFFVLTGCSLLTGEDWISSDDNSGSASRMILKYDLQNYVPIPVEGALAVLSFEDGDMGIEVSWMEAGKEIAMPEEGTDSFSFEPGTKYKANITLTANSNYTFNSEVSFYYPVGLVETQPEENLDPRVRKLSTVTYNITNTSIPIDDPEWLDLTKAITESETGGGVSSVNTAQYMGMVEWGTIGGTGTEKNIAYTLLYARSGYFFPNGVNFTHKDADSMMVSPGDGKTIMVYITFRP
jgi:hypothetical protein